jgi:hypothetical protein
MQLPRTKAPLELLAGVRPMARDLWAAPFSAAVRAGPQGGPFRRGPTMDTKIVLFVSADDINDQGWRHG